MYRTRTRRPSSLTGARRQPGSAFGRPTPGSHRSRPSNNKRNKQYIDPSRFVKAAVTAAEELPYEPQHRFSDFPFDSALQANIKSRNYETPSPIQDQTILPGLEKRDVLGIANTGTGKTAAFLLPLIQHAIDNRDKATVLILAPTRELALQIEKEFQGFAKGLRLGSVAVIGGAPINSQINLLRRDPHFVIGTPGRVKDVLQRGELHLNRFSAVVLDEVDRMLDMGFIRDIRMIMEGLPQERQNLFFSATMTREVENLIDTFMNDPVKVSVKTTETSDNVHQDIVKVPVGANKLDVLHDLLIQPGFDKVLVFGETKRGVERLAKSLAARGFKATDIHGNKTQGQRNRAIEAFKRGEANILVATDVAARGLDIKGVSHVINFSAPQSYEDYVHRIGRTGRAGQTGKALTFID